MNEKLNIQNLIELLAEKHGMNKKDAESFVKEFFQLVEESLETDKYVKIKGLGTFKLINVENRESVNINTGERFEIQGHTKVSFTPEPTLKDLINKPFSHFETVVLNDETVLEDTLVESNSEEEDEKEDENLAGQIAETTIAASEEFVENTELPVDEMKEPIEDDISVEIEEVSTEIEEVVVVEEEKVIEEETINAAAEKETIEAVEETIHVAEEPNFFTTEPVVLTDEPAIEPPVEQLEEDEEDKVPTYEIPNVDEPVAPVDKPDSSTMKFFIGIVVLVVVLCVGAVTFMYYPDLFDRSAPPTEKVADGKAKEPVTPVVLTDTIVRKDTTLVTKADTVAETITPKSTVPESVVESKPATATPEPTVQKENPATASKKDNKKAAPFEPDSVSYKIVGTKATYTIAEGETLTKVALRFYGTKALWPYIVKYNPDVIKNPDHVPYGTVVKIPELVKK